MYSFTIVRAALILLSMCAPELPWFPAESADLDKTRQICTANHTNDLKYVIGIVIFYVQNYKKSENIWLDGNCFWPVFFHSS